MTDSLRWERVATEPLQDCAVFHVHRVRSRSPRTGDVHDFYGIGADPWVNVVALTDDDELVLVHQYRHGADAVTLEIPGGIVDPGEAPAEAAVRELREETGYGGGSLEPLGSVNPNPALFSNRVHTFLARGVRPIGAVENEGHEETRVVLLPRRGLREALRSGAIDHALVVAALLWLSLETPL